MQQPRIVELLPERLRLRRSAVARQDLTHADVSVRIRRWEEAEHSECLRGVVVERMRAHYSQYSLL